MRHRLQSVGAYSMTGELPPKSSWPPEAEAEFEATHDRVFARTESQTGSHDVRKLLHLGQERAIAVEKEKTEEALKRAEKAEARIEAIYDGRRKFWSTVLAGVLIGLFVPVIGFVFWKLVHAG